MKIQIVSYDGVAVKSIYNITNSTFQKPKALDMFDVNIFSLQNDCIWRHKENKQKQIDSTNDFVSIREMICASQKSINIIALPQNYSHRWYFYSGGYHQSCLLKDEVDNLHINLLRAIIPERFIKSFDLIYENSVTKINDCTFESAFCFMNQSNMITKTEGSDKATTIVFGNLILTTLDLQLESAVLDDFIKGIGLDDKKIEFPQWLVDYKSFDDVQQQELIDNCNREISDLNLKIEQANIKIKENLKYKSILSTNGDELYSVVLEILEKLLVYDFSSFIDEKKEDFLCKLNSVTFIGEIKGVTSNVKNEHISQADVHRQRYFDKLCDEGITENLKSLLIINPFRTKPISERYPVHDTQISLAKRNDCLIITTETLLKIFEKFQEGKISNEKVIAVLIRKIGLLTMDAFYEDKTKVYNGVYKV